MKRKQQTGPPAQDPTPESPLESAFEALGVAAARIAPDGTVLDANSALTRLLAVPRSELINSPITHYGLTPAILAQVRDAAAGGGPGPEPELALPRGDGRTVSVRLTSAPAPDGVFLTFHNITRHKATEAALLAAEERFSQLAAASYDWVWEIDAEGRYTYSSPAVETLLGYRPEEVVGHKHFYDFYPLAERALRLQATQAAFQRKEPWRDLVNPCEHRDGRTVWLSSGGAPILGPGGELQGFRGIDTDITEQVHRDAEIRRCEAELVATEDTFQTVVAHANDAVMITGPAGRYIYANARAAAITGWTIDDLLGMSYVELVAPEEVPVIAERSRRREQGEPVPAQYETVFRQPNGSRVEVEVTMARTTWRGQSCTLAIIRDISERRRSEARLKEHVRALRVLNAAAIELAAAPAELDLYRFIAERLRELTGAAFICTSEYDPEDKALLVRSLVPGSNLLDQANRALGGDLATFRTPVSDDIVRWIQSEPTREFQHLTEITFGAIPRPVGTAIQKIAGVDRIFGIAFTWRDELIGTAFLGLTAGSPAPDTDILHTFAGLAAVSLRRKRAEDALQRSEQRFEQVARNSEECIWETDASGKFTYVSPVIRKVLGYTPAELIGTRQPWDLVAPEQRETRRAEMAQIMKRREAYREAVVPCVRRDGRMVWLQDHGLPVLDDTGRLLGYRGATIDVTAHRQAEIDLRRERDRARSYFDLAQVMLVALNADGEVTTVNRRTCEVLGLPEGEIIGRHWFRTFIPERMRAAAGEVFRGLMAGAAAAAAEYENPIITADGSERIIAWHNTVLREPDGRITGTLSSGDDVTEARQNLAALSASEERFRLLHEMAPCGIVLTDEQGQFTSLNQYVGDVTGYSLEELRKIGSIGLYADPDVRRQLLERLEVEGRVTGFEAPLRRKDGSVGTILLNVERVQLDGRRLLFATWLDITTRKQAEREREELNEELRTITERFRQVVENAQEWVWEIDRTGLFTYASPAVEKLLGYRPEEIVGRLHFHDLFLPSERETMRSATMDIFSRHEPLRRFGNTCVHRDGRPVWFETSGVPVLSAAHKLLGYRGVNADVTERVQSEQDLRDREGNFRALVENANEGVLIVNAEGRHLYANEQAARITGYGRDELLAIPATQLTLESERSEAAERLRRSLRGERSPATYERPLLRHDGTVVPVEVTAARTTWKGEIAGLLLFRDITERRRQDEQIRHLNRVLAAIRHVNQLVVRETDRDQLLSDICRSLVDNRGYTAAWVVLVEHTGRFVQLIEAGLDARCTSLRQELEAGRFPACVRNALVADHVIRHEAGGPDCRNCPNTSGIDAEGMSVRLAHRGRTWGVLTVALPPGIDASDEETSLLQEVGDDVGLALRSQASEIDRKEALKNLRASEERFARAFRAGPDAMLICRDTDGQVLEVNDSWEKLFGIPRREALHRSAPDLGLFGAPADHERIRARLKADGQVRDCELTLKLPSGAACQVSLAVEPVEIDGKRCLLAITRDISDRKAAEIRLARQRAVSVAVSKLLRETLMCENDTKVAETCLTLAEHLSGARYGYIMEINTQGRLDTLAVSNPGWQACAIPKKQALASLQDLEVRGLRGQVIRSGEALLCNEPAAHPDWAPTPTGHPPIASFLGVPLRRNGRVEGLIGLSNKEGGFNPDDIEPIETLGVAFIEALDRKRLQVELHKHEQQLEAKVQARTAELMRVNQELESFSYSVSHDLRAPLRAVDGFARILLDENHDLLPAASRRRLQVIRDSTRQMGRLIDDLLTFSRLSRQPVSKQTLNPAEIIRSVLDELAPARANRRIDITLDPLPPCRADPGLLKQVWVNLLSNAIKFTGRRELATIEIGSRLDDRNIGPVYYVKDNGVGFDMAYARKLFSVFQRLHRPEDFEGTGIGLAIVQHIIQRHGGAVWVEAKPDEGATFYFTLPAAEGSTPAGAEIPPAAKTTPEEQ